jgi:hypothetical protein
MCFTKHLQHTGEYLKNMLLLNYAKRQAEKIKVHVRDGILYAGVDWSSLENPHG